jgi:hypothetical protein
VKEKERRLLMALVEMVEQHLHETDDGVVLSYAMSAGEHAIQMLVEYELMEVQGRGHINGRWTEAGMKFRSSSRG